MVILIQLFMCMATSTNCMSNFQDLELSLIPLKLIVFHAQAPSHVQLQKSLVGDTY